MPAGSKNAQAAAMQALPLAVAVVQEIVPAAAQEWGASSTCGDDCEAGSKQRTHALVALAVCDSLLASAEQGLHTASLHGLPQCCAALGAAVSLFAVMMQLAANGQTQAGSVEASAEAQAGLAAMPVQLPQLLRNVTLLCAKLWETASGKAIDWFALLKLSGLQPAQGGSLLQQLLQLHCQACRLVHWLCGCTAEPLARELELEAEAQWTWLLERISSIFVCTNDLLLADRSPLRSGSPAAGAARLTQLAVFAAQLEALTVLLQKGASLQGVGQRSQLAALLAATGPHGAVPGTPVWRAVVALLRSICRNSNTGGQAQHDLLSTVVRVLHDLCSLPVTAGLATSGVLAEMLAAGQRAVPFMDATKAECVASAFASLVGLLGTVYAALHAGGLIQADTGSITQLLVSLKQLCTSPAPPAQQLAQLQTLLPLAMQLAEHLAAYCQQVDRQPEEQLVRARADATRSCAYLRCANVGAEGGPSAGQGLGSMRCGACRAVWYCGTACSHADWREGGHRRVCKALGAERQRQKEEGAQARAAEQAQQAQQQL
ncbi:ankyrin repeat and MYND domain-containing [Chlorella sorokiniana]|uniref:Ankyrin repeat and MYND domain-containing n=1 Tax=Chlorella sorokiniana TaxID=3076 RepID=A0A2P6U2V2_CHLSO|nr:ankyrin repeat and MYND domain-containing [Chlorella sorokiniana]|eukprot:PRW60632.1 ankyrin repeat and MYND domain-containing [Chlorella sorokiniana]